MRSEQEKFVLAIANDLDQDQQTRVRFYINPLAVLRKLPQTAVTLGGFKTTVALEVTTFNLIDPTEPQ